MKELEGYFGATYIDSFQPSIMTETPTTLNNPEMPTIPDSGTEHPKTYAELTSLEKKKIN